MIQGRFYSVFAKTGGGYHEVLIPLVQGCFLFLNRSCPQRSSNRLNPFGSGTFFIQKFGTTTTATLRLNPFGSGTFFIRGYCFSSFVSIGWSDTFQVFVTQESCCLAATQILSGLFAVSGSVSGQARVLSGLYLHGCFVLSRWAFKVLCARSIFMQGLSVVRDRFLGILWLFFDECHRAAF